MLMSMAFAKFVAAFKANRRESVVPRRHRFQNWAGLACNRDVLGEAGYGREKWITRRCRADARHASWNTTPRRSRLRSCKGVHKLPKTCPKRCPRSRVSATHRPTLPNSGQTNDRAWQNSERWWSTVSQHSVLADFGQHVATYGLHLAQLDQFGSTSVRCWSKLAKFDQVDGFRPNLGSRNSGSGQPLNNCPAALGQLRSSPRSLEATLRVGGEELVGDFRVTRFSLPHPASPQTPP